MSVGHDPLGPADVASVVWHDLECGSYTEDLELWRSLADRYGDPVLDIGAGTGRLALHLATAGHRVTALERDGALAAELERRTHDLPITTVRADATNFQLADRFALCIVAMQTLQVLGGPLGRRGFLACAKRHLVTGGVLGAAIVETLEPFVVGDGVSPLPAEVYEQRGVVYCTRPTAVLADSDEFVLERRREMVAGAEHTVIQESLRIDRLTCEQLEREAIACGFAPLGRGSVCASAQHTGSTVVMLVG